jgi:hypothetical protein
MRAKTRLPAGWVEAGPDPDGRITYHHPASGWRVRYWKGFAYPYIPVSPGGMTLTDSRGLYFRTLLGAVRAIARRRRKAGRRGP